MEEIWKNIPGYSGLYKVSNLGRIKSFRKSNEKILKPSLDTNGYYTVTLIGKKRIHQLVAMAFLGHKPCGNKLVVDHINDIKTDNRVENLQILTNRENVYKTQGKYTSVYKGVSWHKQRNKWRAQITIKGKPNHLGLFTSEVEASQAYQTALNIIL